MKINGIELEFNCMESQTARKYEKAVKHAAEMAGRTKEAKKEFQKIDILCRGIKESFDLIFGDGTGAKVCGEKNDLSKCIDAYTQLAEEKDRQTKESIDKTNKLVEIVNGISNKKTPNLPCN